MYALKLLVVLRTLECNTVVTAVIRPRERIGSVLDIDAVVANFAFVSVHTIESRTVRLRSGASLEEHRRKPAASALSRCTPSQPASRWV